MGAFKAPYISTQSGRDDEMQTQILIIYRGSAQSVSWVILMQAEITPSNWR